MATLRQFLLDSDFHGIRFVLDTRTPVCRRLLWFIMCLSSVIGLGHVIVTRVQHYYTYPTSVDQVIKRNTLPLPAIALCPKGSRGIRLGSVTDLTDMDIILLFSHLYVDILVEDVNERGKYKLNDSVIDVARNLTFDGSNAGEQFRNSLFQSAIIQHPSMIESYIRQDVDGFEYIYDMLQRTAIMSRDVSINGLTASYLEFLTRNGIQAERDVYTCEFQTGGVMFDCKQYMRHVITSYGSCLVLDSVNGSGLYFTNYNTWIDMNSLFINYDTPSIKLLLYDSGELFDEYFGEVKHRFDNGVQIALTKVTSHHALGVPYNTERCSQQPRSHCMSECWARQASCVPFYLSNAASAVGKPPCTIQREYTSGLGDGSSKSPVCDRYCINSCHNIQYHLDISESAGGARSYSFVVRPDKEATYDETTQVALYSLGALVADIGGTMGLFIGASALTLYHSMEFVGLWIWTVLAPLTRKIIRHKGSQGMWP